ncbi:hypothetical protein [Alcanivorax sp. 1008]|uniref:hypothetical protein n=1 Tax=Alcanivorax sp. 1008 TaxID=2816853 RepID=UPI001D68BAFA|nr:hypothetical protein [Alcanivorax sp. 1008]MCC1496826.1 hypothetical protein [Alcanivorax sp. 1008]
MTMLRAACLFLAYVLSTSLHAGPPSEDLSVCLSDALTGKDRKTLSRWMFFAQAQHPVLAPFVKISAENIEESDRAVGQLVTHLFTEACPTELAAASIGNPMVLHQAFEVVGRLATMETMSDFGVIDTLSGHTEYTDTVKITEIMRGSISIDEKP